MAFGATGALTTLRSTTTEIDPATEDRLRALGYLDCPGPGYGWKR